MFLMLLSECGCVLQPCKDVDADKEAKIDKKNMIKYLLNNDK